MDETELSERFKVSRTLIREALIHLVSDGIVETRPRCGASALRRRLRQFRRLQLRVRDRLRQLVRRAEGMVARSSPRSRACFDLLHKHVFVQAERYTDLMVSFEPAETFNQASA
jgi:DNA-binding GntR family transcriptional regulator